MAEHLSSQNRRQYPRYNASICYRAASLFSARKPIVDIGLGGIRIHIDEHLKIGKRLEIELILPENTTLTCTVKVVWVSSLVEGNSAKYETGLQFLNISPENVKHLAKVLEQSSS